MKDLLRDYLENFWGYGNENADYWFIGLEEGDLTEGEELKTRFNNWKSTDHPHFMDVKESHRNLSGRKFYFPGRNGEAKFQPTTSRLLQLYFIMSGKYSKEDAIYNSDLFLSDVKKYQATSFARLNDESNSLIMELYPLPCHKASTWVYDDRFPEIDWLSSKSIYKRYMEKTRIPKIFNYIKDQKPKVVCIYCKNAKTEPLVSENYLDTFSERFIRTCIGKQEILYNKSSGTAFFFMRHVVASAGISKEDLFSIGEFVKGLI